MSDEFFEWDRFYDMYERSLTPLRAMKRYKKRRRSMENRQARIDRMRHTIERRMAQSSSSKASSPEDASCETSTSSDSEGTKSS